EPLLPILAAISTLNCGNAAGSETDIATIELASAIRLANGRTINQRHVSSGVSPALGAALSLLRGLTLLTTNSMEKVDVTGLTLTMSIRHRIEQASLVEIVRMDGEAHPGGRLALTATLDNWRGEKSRTDLGIDLPADLAPGEYLLRVSAADADRQWDQARAPGRWDPANLEDLIQMLETEAADDVVVLTLVKREPGVTAAGRDLGRLPPSVLSALAADGVSGPFALTTSRVVARKESALDRVISGSQEMEVTVTANPRSGSGNKQSGGH
ncbi:MAG: hypothetical protein FD129_1359, partial [bacterium]